METGDFYQLIVKIISKNNILYFLLNYYQLKAKE